MNISSKHVSPTISDGAEPEAIRLEFEGARRAFRDLLLDAGENDLGRPSNGTRWSNRELLFRMLFGYLVVRALLPLVKVFSRLPDVVGRGFVAVLNAATRPFNVTNYWGSVAGARLYRDDRMVAKFDAVITRLQRRLAAESVVNMSRSMAYPGRWDRLLQGHHDLGGRLPLPDAAFRVPPTPADSDRRMQTGGRRERSRQRNPERGA